MQSSQLDSALLSKLPRELRDKIYHDAVVEDNDVLIRVTPYVTEDGECRRRLEIGHALMRVCKQTREEVADIYYQENNFRVTQDLFERRAIRELSRFLTPWMEKITKLGISHTVVRVQFGLAKMNFSISAPQGRVVVEPEPSSVQLPAIAVDVGQGTADVVTTTSDRICFCKISKFALEHGGRDVLGWMVEYVDLVLQHGRQSDYDQLLDLAPVHCWTCAGRNVIKVGMNDLLC